MTALECIKDDILVTLDRTLGTIQASRNHTLLILRLPTEVARRIFAFLDDGDIRPKLSVSHTCKHWRTVIITDPFMWTNIDLGTIYSPEIASIAFRHAREYPLRLRCIQWNALRVHCVETEMRRVEELDATYVATIFHRLCGRSAPLLKRLTMTAPNPHEASIHLPYLFLGVHPMLTHLMLVNCRLALTSSNYSGLTQLSIRFPNFTVSLKERYEENFTTILRACPDIEKIRLENLNLFEDTYQSTEVVHLPRLRLMYLRLSPHDSKCLLSSVSASSSLRLSLGPSLAPTMAMTPLDLAGITAPGQQSLLLLTESIYVDADPAKHGIFTYRDTTARRPALSYRAVSPSISTPSDPQKTSSDLNVLMDLHTMCSLQRVRLKDIEPTVILKMLRKFPSITNLELFCSQHAIGNTSVMSAIIKEARSSTQSFLPNLQSLRMQGMHISAHMLFELIELRRACTMLSYLSLHACQSDLQVYEMIGMLRDEFDNVEWTEGPYTQQP